MGGQTVGQLLVGWGVVGGRRPTTMLDQLDKVNRIRARKGLPPIRPKG